MYMQHFISQYFYSPLSYYVYIGDNTIYNIYIYFCVSHQLNVVRNFNARNFLLVVPTAR